MKKRIDFIKTAALDPNIGAVAPSSRYVVKTVLKKLKSKDSGKTNKLINVWEYGPGDGVVTREILKLLPKNGKLTVIETNNNFVKALRQIADNRLEILHGKLQEILPSLLKQIRTEKLEVDAIISSVPFTFFTPRERDQIIRETSLALREGGKLIIFNQYTPLMFFPIKKYLKKLRLNYEFRNLPPCFIFSARK